MNYNLICFIGLFAFCGCNSRAAKEISIIPIDSSLIAQENPLTEPGTFKLYYSYAGLGTGMGSMQPTFKVTGKNYVYTSEQNSFYGKPGKKTEVICKGTLRTSSIDSILNIVKDLKDTLVYKTNVRILGGGIHNISVEYEKINVTFQLHNASDSIAQKIVNLLNSNIPMDNQKLWLFDFPDEK